MDLFGRGIKMDRTHLAFLSGFRTRSMLVTAAFVLWWLVITLHISRSPQSTLMGPSLLSAPREAASLHSLLSANSIADNRLDPNAQSRGGLNDEEEGFEEEEETRIHVQESGMKADQEFSKLDVETGDPCAGRYVYVQDLDPCFNEELLHQCKKLNPWVDWCKFVSNGGLGTVVNNSQGLFPESGAWFETNQFALEMIFHKRMKQYRCLTKESSQAAAIFVPFYAGLELSRNLWGANISIRDEAPAKLVAWLERQSEWKTHYGHDHFMVGGRITWDFRRETDEEKDWGNKLFVLPASLNITLLVIEASHLHQNDVGIPYPTYFHPSFDSQIHQWQDRMRKSSRNSLFSFAGASRAETLGSIREDIITQCSHSTHCKLLPCNDANNICLQPHHLMKLFSKSVFCLQPSGDSYTRRSIFDSMLAGCIPVFFHVRSAYTQYIWHLPANHSSYSVLISGKANIEDLLLRIPAAEVQQMRETVIGLIPSLVYANPLAPPLQTSKDAFDIAVQAVIDRVAAWKVQNQFRGMQQ